MEDGRVVMHGDALSIMRFISARQRSYIDQINSWRPSRCYWTNVKVYYIHVITFFMYSYCIFSWEIVFSISLWSWLSIGARWMYTCSSHHILQASIRYSPFVVSFSVYRIQRGIFCHLVDFHYVMVDNGSTWYWGTPVLPHLSICVCSALMWEEIEESILHDIYNKKGTFIVALVPHHFETRIPAGSLSTNGWTSITLDAIP